LVIDEDAVKSLLEGPIEDAWVWGVDINAWDEGDGEMSEEGEEEEEEEMEERKGWFKVAVNIIIPELWETLQRQAPEELDPGEGEIYRGLFV